MKMNRWFLNRFMHHPLLLNKQTNCVEGQLNSTKRNPLSKLGLRALNLSLVVIPLVATSAAPAVALGAESKAQLHLPWSLVERQITSSLLAEDTSMTDVTPSLQIDARGVTLNLTNFRVATRVPTDAVNVTSTQAEISGKNVPVTITVDQIAVDQVVDETIDGVLVHVHVQGSCGPLVLTQKSALVDALFTLNWSSGSPQSSLQSLNLSWPDNSWSLAPFACVAPQGTPDFLHDMILARVANADDFKPYVQTYIEQNANSSLQKTLDTIRKPFSVSVGSSKQIFSVGILQPVSTGVIADITVSDHGAQVAKPKPLPLSSTLHALSTTQPALLAGKEVLQQILNDVVATQPAYVKYDLQKNSTFHDFLNDRVAQIFVWGDLLNYSTSAPFPLIVYRPKAPAFSVLANSSLQGTVNVQAVVQSYRENAWWTYVNLTGSTVATVKLTVASGKVSYATTLDSTKIQSVYAAAYKAKFHNTGAPPISKLASAVDGVQSALSGSFSWPVANLGSVGKYNVSGLIWLTPSEFVLTWAKQ